MTDLWHFNFNVPEKHVTEIMKFIHRFKTEDTVIQPCAMNGKKGRAGGEGVQAIILRELKTGAYWPGELAQAVEGGGFSKAAAYRATTTLVENGLVRKNKKGQYELTTVKKARKL